MLTKADNLNGNLAVRQNVSLRIRIPGHCELVRNDNVVRCPVFPLQIPISQSAYESRQPELRFIFLRAFVLGIRQIIQGKFTGLYYKAAE